VGFRSRDILPGWPVLAALASGFAATLYASTVLSIKELAVNTDTLTTNARWRPYGMFVGVGVVCVVALVIVILRTDKDLANVRGVLRRRKEKQK